jgi:hypothetical protein
MSFCLKILGISTFLLLSSPLMAEVSQKKNFSFIREANLGSMPVKLRARHHLTMTKILIELEKKEKYPTFYKSRFSSLEFLEKVSDLFIDQCFAADGNNTCLFGGWPSQRNGSCSVPWAPGSRAVADGLETNSYDDNDYCGANNLFRCNPLIFGPGIEQNLAGDDFPEINGRRNNISPYHAGICVDISRGYNRLSQRCQEASVKLDQIREGNNLPPWRESDFFNEERAEDFRSLQNLIADRCSEDRERLNRDGMCSSLDASLGLTAVAVEAGRIDGITPDELFPQCANSTPGQPQCNDELNTDFDNMVAAMEELRNQRQCRFYGIQAIDSESLSQLMDFQDSPCRSGVQGAMKSSGIPTDGAEFSFYFFGSKNERLGRLNISQLRPESTKEEIMAELTTGENQARFESFCNNSTCPRIEDGDLKLESLYSALDRVKEKANCNFGSVQAVDRDTGNNEAFELSQCGLSIEGRLASEGLPHTPGIRGLQQRIPVSVNIRDRQGNFLSKIHLNAASDMTAESIYEQIDNEALQEACVSSNSTNLSDDEGAVADVGISEGTFIPSFWQSRIADLRNVAANNNIEGFRIEVTETGDMILHADDPNQILAHQTQFLNLINNDPEVRTRASFLTSPNGGVRIVGTPPAARVEAIAQRDGVTLSTVERATMADITDGVGIISLARDSSGVITFTSTGKTEEAFSGGEYPGYQVNVSREGNSLSSTVTLTPLDESGQAILNTQPITNTEVPIPVVRPDNGVTGAREPAELPRNVDGDSLTRTQKIYRLDLVDAEDRLSEVFNEEVLDTNPGLNGAYELLIQTAGSFPVTATEVTSDGTAIRVTIDPRGGNRAGYTQQELGLLMDAAEGGATIEQVAVEEGRVIYLIKQ